MKKSSKLFQILSKINSGEITFGWCDEGFIRTGNKVKFLGYYVTIDSNDNRTKLYRNFGLKIEEYLVWDGPNYGYKLNAPMKQLLGFSQ